jgi:hypothetical protein
MTNNNSFDLPKILETMFKILSKILKKNYCYFFSYSFIRKCGQSGYGNLTASFGRQLLKNPDDIIFIANCIKDYEKDLENVVIINIIKININ